MAALEAKQCHKTALDTVLDTPLDTALMLVVTKYTPLQWTVAGKTDYASRDDRRESGN